MTDAALHQARRCVERGEWDDALEALAAVEPEPSTVTDLLELRALAEYGSGGFEAAVGAWEDLHSHCVDAGDVRAAARAAAMVAMYLMMDTGLMAPVRGWLGRAERLVTGDDEAPALALIAMTRAYERFMCGDMEAVRVEAAAAIELGERFAVEPAVVIGRVVTARVTILSGDVDGGIAQLDEIATLLMSGDVDPLTTGMMYCELICAAQGLSLHERAAEWTEVMERWRHGVAFGGINGRCRVHRAELLRVSGPCDAAEAEALAACAELRPWMRREYGWPLVELGTIRLRKGDLDAAEEAFLEAHDHAWSAQPGLALVHLERGETSTAASLIADAIERPFDLPWKERPPFGDLRLAPLLDAQVEIAVAAGDADSADRGARRLRSIADAFPTRVLDASAHLAEGRAALISDDLDGAAAHCTAAIEAWVAVGAPYEAATARTVLGTVCHRSGNDAAARLEWSTARAAFHSFGAHRRADTTQRLLDELPDGHRDEQPERAMSEGVFRVDGDVRVVAFGDAEVEMRDLKGLRYIERLLDSPDREHHVLDLVASESGLGASAARADDELETIEGTGGPLPTIDDEAREAYRRRLAEIDDDIDEASRLNDVGRVELAQRDREFLVAELRRAVGLGGRRRAVGGSAERARSSVTRSVRYAIARLHEQHPAVAAHLDRCVSTGTYCCYRPDPLVAVRWNTTGIMEQH
ncbi:MAG: hypothetical protein R8G01_23120 [Ilumatobacteraceae bacterium]|nr:hypothetical protein [Ilumatobacteraceae bacterium]